MGKKLRIRVLSELDNSEWYAWLDWLSANNKTIDSVLDDFTNGLIKIAEENGLQIFSDVWIADDDDDD